MRAVDGRQMHSGADELPQCGRALDSRPFPAVGELEEARAVERSCISESHPFSYIVKDMVLSSLSIWMVGTSMPGFLRDLPQQSWASWKFTVLKNIWFAIVFLMIILFTIHFVASLYQFFDMWVQALYAVGRPGSEREAARRCIESTAIALVVHYPYRWSVDLTFVDVSPQPTTWWWSLFIWPIFFCLALEFMLAVAHVAVVIHRRLQERSRVQTADGAPGVRAGGI